MSFAEVIQFKKLDDKDLSKGFKSSEKFFANFFVNKILRKIRKFFLLNDLLKEFF